MLRGKVILIICVLIFTSTAFGDENIKSDKKVRDARLEEIASTKTDKQPAVNLKDISTDVDIILIPKGGALVWDGFRWVPEKSVTEVGGNISIKLKSWKDNIVFKYEIASGERSNCFTCYKTAEQLRFCISNSKSGISFFPSEYSGFLPQNYKENDKIIKERASINGKIIEMPLEQAMKIINREKVETIKIWNKIKEVEWVSEALETVEMTIEQANISESKLQGIAAWVVAMAKFEETLNLLTDTLKSGSIIERVDAVKKLGWIYHPKSWHALAKANKDPQNSVQTEAVKILFPLKYSCLVGNDKINWDRLDLGY